MAPSSSTSTEPPPPPPPPPGGNDSSSSLPPAVYYEKGSVELAVETPVMAQRLEKRRHLTSNSECLLIVLVGLPARGKSFVARKLLNYLTWRGNKCKIFNVGKYRRQAAAELQHEDHDHFKDSDGNRQKAGACDANFFDDTNRAAVELRQKVAEMALSDALTWLDEEDVVVTDEASESSNNNNGGGGAPAPMDTTSHTLRRQFQRFAIFDATNTTKERRKWILQQCAEANEVSGKKTGVIFVESICNDRELLEENFNFKISSSPDFADVDRDEALADLQQRVEKYEARYETMDEDELSYIQIFNLGSKVLVNHVYGRLAKVLVPALMGWHTGCRPIFLCRAGETAAMQSYMSQGKLDGGGDGEGQQRHEPAGRKGALTKRRRGDKLGERGLRFRDALCDFVETEGGEFMNRKKVTVIHPRQIDTGTSISGLLRERVPFPCFVMSSTMPRALETASWRIPFPVKDVSNLNPLDTGDFAGMDLQEIHDQHPEWYEQLQQEPFHTRFPGGESYSDLINRLESVVVDVEQQLGPAVVVSHVSVLQVLVSYFRSTPVAECTGIEIPMHTVMKFVPLRGGGWLESHHKLLPDDEPESSADAARPENQPIWGDSRSCLPQKL